MPDQDAASEDGSGLVPDDEPRPAEAGTCLRRGLLGCGVVVAMIACLGGYMALQRSRQVAEGRRTIAAQSPGLWTSVGWPFVNGGILVIGMPLEASLEKRCASIARELAEEIEVDPETLAVIPLRVMNRTRDARPVHGRVVVTFRPASTGKPEGGLELTDANVRDPLKQIAARHGLAARGSWIPPNSTVDMVVPLDISKDVTLVYSDITDIAIAEFAGGFVLGLKPTSDVD